MAALDLRETKENRVLSKQKGDLQSGPDNMGKKVGELLIHACKVFNQYSIVACGLSPLFLIVDDIIMGTNYEDGGISVAYLFKLR